MITMILEYDFSFCSMTANVWQFFGMLLLIFKVVLPAILIIIGIIALGKAVISDEDKDLKKCLTTLFKKLVVAICIFFIPTIISVVFGLVSDFDDVRTDFNVCKSCITHPNGVSCSKKVIALNDGAE